ncbi:hypothetical protein L9F63_001004, partial [Diploptera punctata]
WDFEFEYIRTVRTLICFHETTVSNELLYVHSGPYFGILFDLLCVIVRTFKHTLIHIQLLTSFAEHMQ